MRFRTKTAATALAISASSLFAQSASTQPADPATAAEIAQLKATVDALKKENAALRGDVVAATQATAQAEAKAAEPAAPAPPPPPPAPIPYGRMPLDRGPRGAMTHTIIPDK